MNIDTFFAVASPTTLASLIADIDQAIDTGTQFPPWCIDLRTHAWRELCANIGEADALALVLENRGGVVEGGVA